MSPQQEEPLLHAIDCLALILRVVVLMLCALVAGITAAFVTAWLYRIDATLYTLAAQAWVDTTQLVDRLFWAWANLHG